jgi:predicted nucleic acid-binding protein
MRSKHVFVETNWVVDLVATRLSRNPSAAELLERARRGELTLHVPAIALVEARKVVRERRPRAAVENIRAFVGDMKAEGVFDESTAKVGLDVLARFEQSASNEKKDAPNKISALLDDPAVHVISLDERSLVRSTQLAAESGLELQPFDLAILAAVLVHGEAMYTEGNEVAFCTLDADLQPWDRRGLKKELADLFALAGIWVYGDFLLQTPERPDAWPSA